MSEEIAGFKWDDEENRNGGVKLLKVSKCQQI